MKTQSVVLSTISSEAKRLGAWAVMRHCHSDGKVWKVPGFMLVRFFLSLSFSFGLVLLSVVFTSIFLFGLVVALHTHFVFLLLILFLLHSCVFFIVPVSSSHVRHSSHTSCHPSSNVSPSPLFSPR
ncbi:hypothetical protein QBC45DRAFT_410857 [Copromyces sp. CBS 386.78]|nr:hypothetical protein QBC45DRAFT_410857 [Copromyces sp. CBS 386.78]